MPPRLTFYSWLLAPVALLAYHFGPGQTNLQRDEASAQIALAEKAESQDNWAAATQAYALALVKIPPSEVKLRSQVKLAHAKARMYSGEIIEAIAEMRGMLAENAPEGGDARISEEVRATLGAAEYYAAWLMRLEGAPADDWSVVADSARQNFRLLSENQADPAGGESIEYQENLEATIRLARMDLSELRGLPLPKFCAGCKNVSQKCRGQCESLAKKPRDKPVDARKGGTGERPRGGS
jgi:hypothetical protein